MADDDDDDDDSSSLDVVLLLLLLLLGMPTTRVVLPSSSFKVPVTTVNIPALGREKDEADAEEDDRCKKSCSDSQQGPSKMVVNVLVAPPALEVAIAVAAVAVLLLPILDGDINRVVFKENACTFLTATRIRIRRMSACVLSVVMVSVYW
jgi:hypothetical protein